MLKGRTNIVFLYTARRSRTKKREVAGSIIRAKFLRLFVSFLLNLNCNLFSAAALAFCSSKSRPKRAFNEFIDCEKDSVRASRDGTDEIASIVEFWNDLIMYHTRW